MRRCCLCCVCSRQHAPAVDRFAAPPCSNTHQCGLRAAPNELARAEAKVHRSPPERAAWIRRGTEADRYAARSDCGHLPKRAPRFLSMPCRVGVCRALRVSGGRPVSHGGPTAPCGHSSQTSVTTCSADAGSARVERAQAGGDRPTLSGDEDDQWMRVLKHHGRAVDVQHGALERLRRGWVGPRRA